MIAKFAFKTSRLKVVTCISSYRVKTVPEMWQISSVKHSIPDRVYNEIRTHKENLKNTFSVGAQSDR